MVAALVYILTVGDSALPLPAARAAVAVERTRAATARTASVDSAHFRRNLGWGLAAAGLAAAMAGSVLITIAYHSDSRPGGDYERIIVPYSLGGAALIVTGVAFTIPGIALALLGQMELSEQAYRRPLPSVTITPLGGGGAFVGVAIPLD